MLTPSHTLKTALIMGIALLISGCQTTTTPEFSYDAWQAKQSPSTVRYTTNRMVKINLNWSRIGPFSRYDTWLRSNAFGGMVDVYGTQTCLGKFVRDDRLAPAHGWWELVCPDDSYAAGKFQLSPQGHIQGIGTAINGERVTFDLPVSG